MRLGGMKAFFKKQRTVRRERLLRRTGFLVLGLGFLLLLLTGIMRLPALQLERIIVRGAITVQAEKVRATALELLSGNYMYSIPRGNVLLYPREQIRRVLTEKFLNIASVNFTELSSQELVISLIERKASAVWCEQEFVPIGPRRCYYLDVNGVLYDQAPEFSAPIYFEWYGFLRQPPRLGESVLIESQQRLIDMVRNELRRLNIEPVAITLKSDEGYELMTAKGWKLLFDSRAEARLMMQNLEAILSAEVFTERLKDRGNALEYIDLRFGKKVFYKFKTPEAPALILDDV